jgi:hypothetical protein
VRRVVACLAVLVALAASAGAGPAAADFGIADFGGELAADGNHTPSIQAGAHPFSVTVRFQVNTVSDSFGRVLPDGALRDVRVDLPAGFVGNAVSVPTCPGIKELLSFACPNGSQVGVVTLDLNSGTPFALTAPIYNMSPPEGVPARFAFQINATTQVVMDASIRTGSDYGLSVTIRNASQAIPLLGAAVTFWGVPADPVHDAQRCGFFIVGDQCIGSPNTIIGPNPAGVVPSPFLTDPASCSPTGEPLQTGLEALSWQVPAQSAHATFGLPAMTGCEKLSFEPKLRLSTDATTPDTPTGMELEMTVPQDGLSNLSGLGPADVRDAQVALPDGMSLSPATADGLRACSDDAFAMRVARPPACPDASRIGAVTVDTSLLDEPLSGSVFVGDQRSDDPESGELFRVLLYAAAGARGVFVKLPGQVRADAATGDVEATFANNPQLPFARLAVRFKGGMRAPFATPASCGTRQLAATFTSWAGHARSLAQDASIACGGTPAFAPTFAAGSVDPVAGAFTPMRLRFGREDGEPYFRGLAVRMPRGVLAKPAGVELCDDRHAADGTCSAASRIGSVVATAGPGSDPLVVHGTVHLTESYRGAPYGLADVVPVKVGPFDLGTVVVRQAVHVDPVDARLSVVSDPLPTIVRGIPIRLRGVAVDVDRRDFTLNPTSCARKSIAAVFGGLGGESAARSSRFQVGDCGALRFRPRTRMRLTGRGHTAIGAHPGIVATVDTRGNRTNIKKVRVGLPLALALDPANARQLCGYQDGLEATCPRASIVGSATARTPLLNRPLTGPVYLVEGVRRDRRTGRPIRTFPTLLVALRGEVAIDLRASTTVRDDHLVATFARVPDAPIDRFTLRMRSGRGGILVVTRRLCGRPQVANLRMDAQNGSRRDGGVTLGTGCPG